MKKFVVTIGGHTYEVHLQPDPADQSRYSVMVDGETLEITVPNDAYGFDDIKWLLVDDRPHELIFDRDLKWVRARRGVHTLAVRDLNAAAVPASSGNGRIRAPIPGLIRRVLVEVGQTVEAGEPVVILEAMKMENEIVATTRGAVQAIYIESGQSVTRNEVLLEIG